MGKIPTGQTPGFPDNVKYLDSVRESAKLSYQFKFGLFSIVTDGSDFYRIIGYKKVDGKYCYVFIREYSLTGPVTDTSKGTVTRRLEYEIPLMVKTKEWLEDSVKMKSIDSLFAGHGILSQPKKGDIVMCIGNQRYMGVNFERIYTVHDVYKEDGILRVKVDGNSEYSYEAQYFIVIQRAEKQKGQLQEIIDDCVNEPVFNTLADRLVDGNPCGEMALCADGFSTQMINRKSIEDNQIKKKDTLPADGLIRRKIDNVDKIRAREIFQPDLLRRTKV